MSITKQMLEDHAKLIQQKLGIVVKTDAAAVSALAKADAPKVGAWFSTMATTETTKLEAFAKSHPGVLTAGFLGMLVGFALGFLLGHIT